ncbi:HIT domain-containing protein [Candidatus Dependentiae bacterium]|nr:HIT domain-containing protein [Candidatus Dependentiae bacterium]
MSTCLFCKIIEKEIPSDFVAENEHVIVIKDIQPKAPIHYLIIPKIHVPTINDILDTHEHTIAIQAMWGMLRNLAKNLPEPQAFNLIVNNGAASGQRVFHMHWHFISGKNIYSSGIKL